MKPKILLLFILFFAPCLATDLKPWFGIDSEVELRATSIWQNFNSISSPYRRCYKQGENDGFLTLSAAYPFRRYCCEFETTVAQTRVQNKRWDHFRLAGRYQLSNESEGDFITITAGLVLTEPLTRALHDLSSFHHGHLEGEAILSIGKQYGYLEGKKSRFRWWTVIGVGAADEGSPWVQEDAAVEFHCFARHLFRGFINTLWGAGKESLNPYHFTGYGSVRHRSIDIGVRYGYLIGHYGALSIQYARRVYARNFPNNANIVLLEYYLPFGTQLIFNY